MPYRWTGPSGFTVDSTRRVYADGRLLRDERFQTRCDPQHAVGARLPAAQG
jgi:hypothetical protein